MIVRTQTVRFSPDRTPMPRKVKIGYESDNMVERLVFVLPDIAESQTATMMMDGEYANMVTLTAMDENDKYFADMTAERVGGAGEAECYIVIDGENGEVWNSGTFRLVTGELPDVSGTLSEYYPDAVEQMRADIAAHRAEMEEQTGEVEEIAQRAEEAAKKAENALTDGAVISVNGKKGAVQLSAADVGAVGTAELPDAIEEALAQAKASGEFDGAQGEPGAEGKDGFSPTVEVVQLDGGHRITITDAEGAKSFEVLDGKDGTGGGTGNGEDGGYYLPTVTDGVLSWSASKAGMPAVESAVVKGDTGPQGEKGEKGDTGEQGPQGEKGDTGPQGPAGAEGAPGEDGYTPVKGVDYFDGEPGKDGAQGPKGEKGDTGEQGPQGEKGDTGPKGEKGDTGPQGEKGDTGPRGADGSSVTVSSVSQSTADGGSNVVAFSDGKTLSVKNGNTGAAGKDGAQGPKGEDGKTPVKGTDYYTEADKTEMVQSVKSALTSETWTFTLEDDSTVSKVVLLG